MAAEVKDYPLILLAGGKSERMGTPKGLLSFDGRLWIEEQMSRFERAGGREGVIVLGFHAEDYRTKVRGRPGWHSLINPEPELGPFTSIQAGAKFLLGQDRIGAFVLPVDVPAGPPEVFQALCGAMNEGVRAAVPQFQERGGHPVLLSAAFLDHLAAQDPRLPMARLDQQLRLLGPDQVRRVPVSAPEVTMNFNTIEDWKNLRIMG
ncbi:MAG: nucleotidyltransferase family protein [Bdellovibrionota bacterium]